MFLRVMVLVVVCLVAPVAARAELGRPELEVAGGFGRATTKWDIPSSPGNPGSATPRSLTGGESWRLKAILTVPLTERFTVLLGLSRETWDRGAMMDGNQYTTGLYFANDRRTLGEFGFRVRL